ncbi:hypothetical protein Tco_1563107 [Tanacetum coccineum]
MSAFKSTLQTQFHICSSVTVLFGHDEYVYMTRNKFYKTLDSIFQNSVNTDQPWDLRKRLDTSNALDALDAEYSDNPESNGDRIKKSRYNTDHGMMPHVDDLADISDPYIMK